MARRGKGGYHHLGDRVLSDRIYQPDDRDRFPSVSVDKGRPLTMIADSPVPSHADVSNADVHLPDLESKTTPASDAVLIAAEASAIIPDPDQVTYSSMIGPRWPSDHFACWRCVVPHKDLSQCNALNATCTKCFIVGHLSAVAPRTRPVFALSGLPGGDSVSVRVELAMTSWPAVILTNLRDSYL